MLNTYDTDVDTLSMGLRLEKGFRISKLIDRKLVKSKQFKTLQDKKIIFEKDGFIVLSKNYLIKLNSIINFLMDD
jgi:coproporphyrinogen III oxidase-like Fe-S oxidoreductase